MNTKWTKTKDLSVGMKIAAADLDRQGMFWDEIVSIQPVGRQRVWDIEVEGTHNFVGNQLIAHNTYINSSATTGVSLDMDANSLTTGTGLDLSSTANGYTTGKILNVDLTQSAATGTSVSGNISAINFAPTYSTAVTTPAVSGNTLSVTRTATTNSLFASTLTVSGALASFSDSATQTTGTLTSTADVVRIAQNYTSNSGSALNLTSAGTGLAMRVNDDGTFTDTTAFVVDSSGQVGIGTTAPTGKLHVSGAVTGKALAIFDETGDQDIFTASASGATKYTI
ncbi:hypothetical protein HYS82_00535, partial [Candidatus Amesbacteria bacterium]|nr:hypothetical protein [Candidatus Amesbacteria bacterium]